MDPEKWLKEEKSEKWGKNKNVTQSSLDEHSIIDHLRIERIIWCCIAEVGCQCPRVSDEKIESGVETRMACRMILWSMPSASHSWL
ncbi:hypothetical protein CUMW_027280 [Citrus unshiu]|nr:hypothetical protein CUMW_027280 [Citrus unshiu]